MLVSHAHHAAIYLLNFCITITHNFRYIFLGDFFAVRITEDPVYGTPIFTTVGGKSKCPGETGTTRRESGVKIVQIIDRCCVSNPVDCSCSIPPLPSGTYATFGVIIENDSPSGSLLFYSIILPF